MKKINAFSIYLSEEAYKKTGFLRNPGTQYLISFELSIVSPDLNFAIFHEKELCKGNRKRATLAVARKLVAYMMAVDKGQRKFTMTEMELEEAA